MQCFPTFTRKTPQIYCMKGNPMKGNSPDPNQPSFLFNGLREQLNPRHPIYQPSEHIDWSSLEDDFARLYSRGGRPANPVRLMVSLLLLKQLHDPSDDQVVERWIDNPSRQFLSGEKEKMLPQRRIRRSDQCHHGRYCPQPEKMDPAQAGSFFWAFF